MNLADTHRLLTAIAAVDNRRFDDATVTAWRHILIDHEYADCAQAAMDHFREQPDDYLMPGHIHRRAAMLASRRLGAQRRAELDAQLAIEDAETIERTPDVMELVDRLAAKMGTGNPDVLRRREWVEHERRTRREAEIGPNPLYNPARAAQLAREASA